MKFLFYLVPIVFLFSCKKENNSTFKTPKKEGIQIHKIASLDGNISYNADPNANPNFVNMRNIKKDGDKIAEKELFKQNYFKDSILNIRKFKDLVKTNENYFLDNKKTIRFTKIINKNGEIKFKVQRGSEISIFDLGSSIGIDGIELIDLNKDGIKDILVLQEGYVSNNFLYNFIVYSVVQ